MPSGQQTRLIMQQGFQLDLSKPQWERIAARSQVLKFLGSRALGKGEEYVDLVMPVYTNAREEQLYGVREAGNMRWLGQEGVTIYSAFKRKVHFGDEDAMDVQRFRRKTKPVLGLNPCHLLWALAVLMGDDWHPQPFLTYFESRLSEWIYITSYLASPYLALYGGRWMVNDRNCVLYLQRVIGEGVLNASEYRELVDVLVVQNGLLQGDGFEMGCFEGLWQGDRRRYTKLMGRRYRREMQYIEEFWSKQGEGVVRCIFCGDGLRQHPIRLLGSGVQIMPCCLSLACFDCTNKFLFDNVACPHVFPCVDILKCITETPPWTVGITPDGKCPKCASEFLAGIYVREIKYNKQSKRRSIWLGNIWNYFELFYGPFRQHYLYTVVAEAAVRLAGRRWKMRYMPYALKVRGGELQQGDEDVEQE